MSNYRLGKTLGIGSFGKVSVSWYSCQDVRTCFLNLGGLLLSSPTLRHMTAFQVKIAEHITTSHKVAIKILNKKKIKQMDMEEKGMDKYMSYPT